jgi:hypothetical protein
MFLLVYVFLHHHPADELLTLLLFITRRKFYKMLLVEELPAREILAQLRLKIMSNMRQIT